MGIHDRDYYRNDNQNWNRPNRNRKQLSMIAWIILINVGLYLINGLFCPLNELTHYLAINGESMRNPLNWYRVLTYGFAHDPSGLGHILGNMLVLFFLGGLIEQKLGRKEFLLFYLFAIITGGLVWTLLHLSSHAVLLGASGGVCGVVILFALYYPNIQLLLFGIIPMPAWLLGVMYVFFDMIGAMDSSSNVAHGVHLVGAGFAFLYYLSHFRFETFISKITDRSKKSNRNLNIPENRSQSSKYASRSSKYESQLEKEVNRLLDKINESGESSLTESERNTLKKASREYQKRMKD